MNHLQLVISNSLKIFTQKELQKLAKQQMQILQSEGPEIAQDIREKYFSRFRYVRKNELIVILSEILTWKIQNTRSINSFSLNPNEL